MLNKTKIKALKPQDKLYRVNDDKGLYLEVTPSGSKLWRYRYRTSTGKSTMKSLGAWPDVSLEAARSERDQIIARNNYSNTTFLEAARAWYGTQTYRSEKNKRQVWTMIERYLVPSLGSMRMADIKAHDILPILKEIEGRGKLEQCKRVRTKASQIFRYGVSNLMCEYDPAHLVRDATAKPRPASRAAIVDEAGFGALLRTIDQAENLNLFVKIGLQLSPYLLLRSAELRNLKCQHISTDKAVLAVPGDIMKKGRDHIVPLTPRVVELLELADQHRPKDCDLVLPGLRPGRPLSENAFNQALRSLGYTGDRHVHHGFRSSFSTLAREVLRIENDLIERQLAHVQKDSVRAAYDRSHRLEDRAAMMTAWGSYLDSLRTDCSS